MMKSILLLLLATVVVTTSPPADAQQPNKVFRLGYISVLDAARESGRVEAIRRALQDLGYVDGQNLKFEFRYTEGKLERAPELAAELVRLKVDIIVVAGGTGPIQMAQKATKTIPIVMSLNADPVETKLIDSLASPGGNLTGLTTLSRELGGKRLELIKEAVAKLSRVAVLYSPVPQSKTEVKEVLPIAARALGLTLRPWEIRSEEDFEKTFAALNRQRPDGLYVTSGGGMNANHKRIAGFALKSRLPSVFSSPEAVDAGGLMYYGADLAATNRRIAYYIDRILKGTKPADLPVEQPMKFEFVINLKTAKQIGVTIAAEVLARASRIIK